MTCSIPTWRRGYWRDVAPSILAPASELCSAEPVLNLDPDERWPGVTGRNSNRIGAGAALDRCRTSAQRDPDALCCGSCGDQRHGRTLSAVHRRPRQDQAAIEESCCCRHARQVSASAAPSSTGLRRADNRDRQTPPANQRLFHHRQQASVLNHLEGSRQPAVLADPGHMPLPTDAPRSYTRRTPACTP